MNELANLCAAIEAMPHPERCPSWALSPPHAVDDSLCTCERRKALVALDALERRLREDVLRNLVNAFNTQSSIDATIPMYDEKHIALASRKLTKILDSQ